MNFLCIPTFTKELKKLTKKVKLGYSNCCDDIIVEFKDDHEQEAVLKGSSLSHKTIEMNGKNWWYKKTRIPNSNSSSGKSGAYRIYYLISDEGDIIILLTVYPKTGKYKKISLKHKEEENLLNTFIEEKDDLLKYNPEKKQFEPLVK